VELADPVTTLEVQESQQLKELAASCRREGIQTLVDWALKLAKASASRKVSPGTDDRTV
jgi:hypothetical protein